MKDIVGDNQRAETLRLKFIGLRKTYSLMHGSIYPPSIYRELMELRAKYIRAGGAEADLPFTPPPQGTGHAPVFHA